MTSNMQTELFKLSVRPDGVHEIQYQHTGGPVAVLTASGVTIEEHLLSILNQHGTALAALKCASTALLEISAYNLTKPDPEITRIMLSDNMTVFTDAASELKPV
jgi:hypothetical protein